MSRFGIALNSVGVALVAWELNRWLACNTSCYDSRYGVLLGGALGLFLTLLFSTLTEDR